MDIFTKTPKYSYFYVYVSLCELLYVFLMAWLHLKCLASGQPLF